MPIKTQKTDAEQESTVSSESTHWKAPTGHYFEIGLVVSALFAALVFFIVGVTVAYLYITPTDVKVQQNANNITANGVTPLEIIVTAKNIFSLPLPNTKVSAESTLGKIENGSCLTNQEGRCTLLFIPPKSLQEQDVKITITAGWSSTVTHVQMKPDLPASIIFTLPFSTLPANGYSSTTVSVMVMDNVNGIVPDNTPVSFYLLPVESGKLSSNTCYTSNGQCTISFTSSTNPTTANITAVSSQINSTAVLTLTKLAPKYLQLETINSSLLADGVSSTVVTVKVTNELSKPVNSVSVLLSTNSGTLSSSSCVTGNNGQCYVTYYPPKKAGSAKIEAEVNDSSPKLLSSLSLTLVPVSTIKATIKLMENLGDPIIPAFVQGRTYLGVEMAEITLTNNGSGEFSGSVKLEISGWSDADTKTTTIPAGSTKTIRLSPPLNSKALANQNTVSVNYLLTLTDTQGKKILEQTKSATLAPITTMAWGSEYDPLISAWVTPNTNSVHKLVSDAASYTPWNSMPGYQQISGYTLDEVTYYQLKAIYDTLQARGMKYVNAPEGFIGTQTVYTPSQSLAVNGGNCIDGTLVFASALSSMGMRPVIALTPSHAFICVATWSNTNTVICAETTLMGTGKSFQNAYTSASTTFTTHKTAGTLTMIDVNYYLSNGVKSLPS